MRDLNPIMHLPGGGVAKLSSRDTAGMHPVIAGQTRSAPHKGPGSLLQQGSLLRVDPPEKPR